MRSRMAIACAALLAGSHLAVFAASSSAQGVRVIELGDENGDGRYTGVDVELALAKCRPGCSLHAGAHRYDDVAVVIDKRFPNGLEIVGAGADETSFRSAVPVRAPVFQVKGGQPGVVFRDFTIDGRKVEQTNDSSIADSVGIRVSDPSLTPSDSGRIESVTIKHFLTAGILVRDGRNWKIRNNHVEDIGCHTSQPCPRMPGEDVNANFKGRRTNAFGVMLNSVGASGAVVEGNRVAKVTKIGIETYTNLSRLGSDKRVRDVRINDNRVSGALAAGITSNGGVGIQITRNEVWDTGGEGLIGNGGAGISCGGPSERIVIAENIVHDTDGAGIRANCQGDELIIRNNRVDRPCRKQAVEQGAIQVIGRKGDKSSGLLVEGNRVVTGVGRCAYALSVLRWRDIQVSGGEYHGGSRAAVFLGSVMRVRLGGLAVSVPGKPLLWVRRDVSSVSVTADAGIEPSDIKDEGATGIVFEH